uniref:Uncharacterized protein n=1 Tax=Brassica oleracea var. oleracea TaxID=109376 RepID=A0A0D3CY05_BRAOL
MLPGSLKLPSSMCSRSTFMFPSICLHCNLLDQFSFFSVMQGFISANRAPRYEPQLKPGASEFLRNHNRLDELMRDCGCKSFLLRIPRIGYQLLAFASRPVPSFQSFSLPSPSASASHCLETSKWIRFFYESLMIFSVAFHSSGFVSSDPLFDLSTLALSVCGYLQSIEGDGAKIFVSCIAFRDRVCDDVTEPYRLPPNTYAYKCICIISHAPNFPALRDSLEEIFVLCFSSERSCKPFWDIIAMFSVSLFALYLIAKLVNEGEVTKAETMTIGEIFDYIKKGSAKVELELSTGETTFAATAELPLLSANFLSPSSKGCGDLADEGMLAPFDLTKKKMMNVILDPIEDSTGSQAEETYSLLAFDGIQSSFAGHKSASLLTSCFF